MTKSMTKSMIIKIFPTSFNKTFSKNSIQFFLLSRINPLASRSVLGFGLILVSGNGLDLGLDLITTKRLYFLTSIIFYI